MHAELAAERPRLIWPPMARAPRFLGRRRRADTLASVSAEKEIEAARAAVVAAKEAQQQADESLKERDRLVRELWKKAPHLGATEIGRLIGLTESNVRWICRRLITTTEGRRRVGRPRVDDTD